MAERRMLTKKVTDDDNFLSLSASAQALYLHLSMAADDDGFCNQVSVAMFKAHASVADLEALLTRRYVYQFENGVIVIKHWRMANALRKDRYTPTTFKEELSRLRLKENGAYTMTRERGEFSAVAERLPDGCQMVAERLPQDRLGKDSIGKDSIGKDSKGDSKGGKQKFSPPTLEEVKAYCAERGNNVDPEAFINHYQSVNWYRGKTKISDWKACVRTWEKDKFSKPKKTTMPPMPKPMDGGDDADRLSKMLGV